MRYQLDRRTRRDEQCVDHVPIDDFFLRDFPKLVAAHGAIVAAGWKALAARPLTVDVESDRWTVLRQGDTIAAEKRDHDDALQVHLTSDQFTKWVQNLFSLNGFAVQRALRFENGSVEDVSVWDSLWIALLEGWPLVDPDLSFVDRHGEPLDLDASFAPGDRPEDIAHFLREAGFVHLRGWLDPADMAAISVEMDAAISDYVEGDGKSWWVTTADGGRACARMQAFVERSPTTAKVLSSNMWEMMVRTLEQSDRLARKPVEGRIIEALIKPVGVVSGPSDLSFHRDCHLGRHAFACSRMTVGVAITASNASNGQLRVVAGSHRLAIPVEVAKIRPYLPVVALSTEPGDLTVHLSCTLHEATPPIATERRVLYTELPLREADGRLIDTSVQEVRDRIDALVAG